MPGSHREQSRINKLLQSIEALPDPYPMRFAKRYARYVLEENDVDPFSEKGELIHLPKQHKAFGFIREFLAEYVVYNTERTNKEDIAKRLQPLIQLSSRDEQKRMQAFLSNASGNFEFISKQFHI